MPCQDLNKSLLRLTSIFREVDKKIKFLNTSIKKYRDEILRSNEEISDIESILLSIKNSDNVTLTAMALSAFDKSDAIHDSLEKDIMSLKMILNKIDSIHTRAIKIFSDIAKINDFIQINFNRAESLYDKTLKTQNKSCKEYEKINDLFLNIKQIVDPSLDIVKSFSKEVIESTYMEDIRHSINVLINSLKTKQQILKTEGV